MLLQLSDIWQALVSHVRPPAALSDRAVTSAVVDSRQAQPHGLFVALPGAKTDGHLFIADAFARGASAAIAEPRALELGLHATFVLPDGTLRPAESRQDRGRTRRLHRAQQPGRTTKARCLVARSPASGGGRHHGQRRQDDHQRDRGGCAGTALRDVRSEGNLNNEIGLPLSLLRLTPQHRTGRPGDGHVRSGRDRPAVPLAQPSIGMVTNVGPTHLERLGTIERIAQAKSELPQALPPADAGGRRHPECRRSPGHGDGRADSRSGIHLWPECSQRSVGR